jgi:hypothetical protein
MIRSKSNAAAAAAAVTRGAKRTSRSKKSKGPKGGAKTSMGGAGTKVTDGTKGGADKASLRDDVASLHGAVDRLTLWVRALAMVVASMCVTVSIGVVIVARCPSMGGRAALPREPVAAFETGGARDAPPAHAPRTSGGRFPVAAARVSSERGAPSSSKRRLQLFRDASAGSPAPGGTATVFLSEGGPDDEGTAATAAVSAGVFYSPDLLEVRCKEVLNFSLLEDHQVSLLRETVEACCHDWYVQY